MKKSSELSQLKNIGPTILKRLHEVGIVTRGDLQKVGPAKAYRLICQNYPYQTIPVCYYLYSLHGALMDCYWNHVPQKIKNQLLATAKPHTGGITGGAR
jgi:DNA transformation protein